MCTDRQCSDMKIVNEVIAIFAMNYTKLELLRHETVGSSMFPDSKVAEEDLVSVR